MYVWEEKAALADEIVRAAASEYRCDVYDIFLKGCNKLGARKARKEIIKALDGLNWSVGDIAYYMIRGTSTVEYHLTGVIPEYFRRAA